MADETNATVGAQELAEQHGLDVESIDGTGADGRVIKQDVQDALQADDEPTADSSASSASGADAGSDSAAAAQPAQDNDQRVYVEFNPNHPDLGFDATSLHINGRDFYPGSNNLRNAILESEWDQFKDAGKSPGQNTPYLKKGGPVDA